MRIRVCATLLLAACSDPGTTAPPTIIPPPIECTDECPAITLDVTGAVTIVEGGTKTIHAVLRGTPASPVTLEISDLSESNAVAIPGTFTLSAPQDRVRNGNRTVLVTYAVRSDDARYAAILVSDLLVTIEDDDVPGFDVAMQGALVTTEAGGSATFALTLRQAPASDVVVTPISSDATEGTISPATLTFTPENWARAQVITVTGVDDPTPDGDVAYEIRATVDTVDPAYSNLPFSPVPATNTDDDHPNVVFSRVPVVTRASGTSVMISVQLDNPPTHEVTIALSPSSTEATVSPASVTFDAGNTLPRYIAVTGADDLIVDGAQSFAIVTGPPVSLDPVWNGVEVDDLWGVNLDDEPLVPDLTRVSVDPAGAPGNGAASFVGVSWDGQFVVFSALARNLAAGDRNNVTDVFVRDVAKGITVPASIDNAGMFGTAANLGPRISANGRYVTFHTESALTSVPTNAWTQLYLRDLAMNTTTLISKLTPDRAFEDSIVEASMSYDAEVIAISTNQFRPMGSVPQWDVHVLHRSTGRWTPGALTRDGRTPNLGSRWARLSADGRLLAFVSAASDIVPDDTNGMDDLFLRDLETGAVERVSRPEAGGNDMGRVSLPPALSADGWIIAFSTFATLLPEDTYGVADIYVRDIQRGTLEVIQLLTASPASAVDISADGRFVMIASTADNVDLDHPQGANGVTYPMIYDRTTHTLRRLLNASTTGVASVALSGDGRYLAIASEDPSYGPMGGAMSHAYLVPQPIGQ